MFAWTCMCRLVSCVATHVQNCMQSEQNFQTTIYLELHQVSNASRFQIPVKMLSARFGTVPLRQLCRERRIARSIRCKAEEDFSTLTGESLLRITQRASISVFVIFIHQSSCNCLAQGSACCACTEVLSCIHASMPMLHASISCIRV